MPRGNNPFDWKQEELAAAKEMWASGMIAKDVAAELNRLFPGKRLYNKNVVIGVAHRNGWAKRKRQRFSKLPTSAPPKEEAECRWVLNDLTWVGAPVVYCGEPATDAKIRLCPAHMCAALRGDRDDDS